jgi:hypothetical protein
MIGLGSGNLLNMGAGNVAIDPGALAGLNPRRAGG